jgi:ParB-like chromosome segregation protein Spo0J
LKLESIRLQDLNPYENNPRINDNAVESVMNSIKEFGFKVPIVITKDNVIVAGHTRYKASLELGLEKVPCIIADDLTDEQIKAFRLTDNKVSELADWDFEKLEKELEDINLDMSLFSFEINDFEDEIEDFDDVELPRDERGTKSQIKSLKFGSIQIPMTDEEFNLFDSIYNNYVNDHKTNLGFIMELIENGGSNYAY